VTSFVPYTKRQLREQSLQTTDAALKAAKVILKKVSKNGFSQVFDGGRNGSLSVLSSGELILKGDATVMIQSTEGKFKKSLSLLYSLHTSCLSFLASYNNSTTK
jgi:hypothetical protein